MSFSSNEEKTGHEAIQYSIFSGRYELLKKLGDGSTSRVYLCRKLSNPRKKFALKIFRHQYLQNKELGITQIEEEIKILHGLDHPNITKMHGFGTDGTILKPSGQVISNLVYVILEYVDGMLLFDKC